MNDRKALIKFMILISDIQDYEEAEYYLSESGYNVDEILSEGRDFLKKIKAQADLKLAKKNRKLFEKAKQLLSVKVHDKPKDELFRILSSLKPKLSVQFSKIEKLDDRDAQELLKEEELLKLIQKLEDYEQR